MENPESSSESPHSTERRPLTQGLTMQNVREKLNTVEMRTYSRRLRDLAMCEAGYRYEDEQGRRRIYDLPSPEYLRREIYATERQVLERMHGGRSEPGGSEAKQPGVTEPQPRTTGLTMENVLNVLRGRELASYTRRLGELALCEAGYRYDDPDGCRRKRPLPDPDHLRGEIYETEMRVLNEVHEGRSEQGGSEAEGEELDWEPLGQLDVAQAEQGGAQAEGE
ncbi:hypothetical protein GZH46_03111, partial [Fragariocoptes setiger]